MSFSLELPSGNVVTFREPRNKDRQYVLEMVKPGEKVSVDEILASHCLESINGNAVKDPDPRHRMDVWAIKDSQFYVALFLEMFTVGEDEMKEIREKAKKLLKKDIEVTSD